MHDQRLASLGRVPARRAWRAASARRGNLARLALYLVASALLGHWQAARPSSVSLHGGLAAAITPVVAGLSAIANAVHQAAAVVPRTRAITEENRRLRSEIERMRRADAAAAEQSLENDRLRRLLGLRATVAYDCIAANVVGRRLAQWPTAIILDQGRADGVRPRQPVIAAGGLVGRIYSVAPHSAVVIPLTDRNSSAGALVQRSREAGILEGDGDACRLNYLSLDADVKPGDVVVSSGLGGIFPKGVLMGTVESVAAEETAAVKYAMVRPSVDLSRLEEVLVVRK